MIVREHGCGDRHERKAVRPVFVVLPPFVQDHIALSLEPLLRKGGQQISHAVGFHPERQVDRALGNNFPVIGAVGVRGSVEECARLLQRREVSRIVVLRSFEHQVLEEMRKTGAARTLVLGPDVIPDVEGDDRDVVILMNDDVEPVGKGPFDEGKRRGNHFSASYREPGISRSGA